MNDIIIIINSSSRIHLRSLLFLFLFLVLSPLVLTPVGGDQAESQKGQRGPSLVERAIGVTGLNSRWDAARTWAKLAWMNLRPPDATFGQGTDSASVVKEAATSSFETSKETVEQAAKVAGEAVVKTAETLKRTMSGERVTNEEL